VRSVFILYQSNFVSVLFNEPKLLKAYAALDYLLVDGVSVLFNEPKLLKTCWRGCWSKPRWWFQCSSTSRNC